MKALNMSMPATTPGRVRDMNVLKGGIGSTTLKPHQIKDILRRKREERELRQWQKFGEKSTSRKILAKLTKKSKS